jgi:SAM-dependent methyltransferase
MGFDIFQPVEPEQNWLIQDFTEAGTKATKPVLDIGTGYGNMVFKILPNASTVIINDIAVEHLLSVRQFASIKPEHLKKLYLNHNAFPEETSFPTSSLSIVILDGVLPFLDGYQIEAGFRKIANWLEPGGKIYIISTSPTHPQISEWYLPIYVQKWREGNKWPGMHLDVAKAFPDQLYNLPPYIHVMDEKPLIYALKKAGFYIEKSGYIKRDYGNSSSQNDKDNIGIIAVRKKKTLF